MIRLLADITRSALKGKPFKAEITNPEDLHGYAKGAGISGMFYQTLKNDCLPDEVVTDFRRDYLKYIQNDTHQRDAIKKIRDLLNRQGIRFVFLKGTVLKEIYPQSYMRSMGDIDLLIDAKNMEKAHRVLESNGFRNWHNAPNHDCFVSKQNVFVEVHPKLNSDFDERYDALFENVWERTVKENEFERRFTPEFMYAYLLYHAIKHLRSSGIGFRTFVDYYVFLSAYQNDLDWNALDGILEKGNMRRFNHVILTALDCWFDTDFRSCCNQKADVSSDVITKLESYVLVSGVHGKNEGHNPFIGRIAMASKQTQRPLLGKIRFAFHMAFLPLDKMKTMYPFLKKHPWLLPYAWGKRWFGILFGKKHSFRKIRHLNPDKQQVEGVKSLMEDLNI